LELGLRSSQLASPERKHYARIASMEASKQAKVQDFLTGKRRGVRTNGSLLQSTAARQPPGRGQVTAQHNTGKAGRRPRELRTARRGQEEDEPRQGKM